MITGDHTFHAARNDFVAGFHVPLLILGPGLPASRDTRTAGHVDILPTLLDLLGIPSEHAAMGRSLLATKDRGATIVRSGPHYAIIQDSLVLLHDLEKRIGMYLVDSDRGFTRDVSSQYSQEAARLERALLGFLQTATHAMRADRIYRDGGTTPK